MQQGWICLHRGLLDWEWYSDINATRLFIHCLLRANHKPKKWRGISIDRGQFWTSVATLTKETGLSASKIKTSISKLEMTGELASKGQAGGRMITVLKYNDYQENDQQADKPLASQSPASDQPLATNNNDNNKNNENNVTKKKADKAPPVDFSSMGMTDNQISELKRIRKQNKGGPLTQRVVNGLAKEFHLACSYGNSFDDVLTEWETRGWKSIKGNWFAPDRTGHGANRPDPLQNTMQALLNTDLPDLS